MKKLLLIILLGASTANAAEYVIGLPKAFPDNKQVLYQTIERFVTHDMNQGDNIWFYNAHALQSLGTIKIPTNSKAWRYPKVRKKQSRKVLKPLKAHIEQLPSNGLASINFPRFLDHLATDVFGGIGAADSQINVLVIGNAEHRDRHEPFFNMRDGWFPSDGHLEVGSATSIYGTQDKQGHLNGFRVHFLHTNKPDSWYNDLYRHRIERFWHLFVKAQGGELITFTPDALTAFNRFQKKDFLPAENYTLDHTSGKVEMLRAHRNGMPSPNVAHAVSDGSRFLERDTSISTLPPAKTKGTIKIGIRWKCNQCDIDLYARGSNGTSFLHYANVENGEGKYFKDFRSSPDSINGLEHIDFTTPVNIYDLQVLVNHYKGKDINGPDGAVRIFFDGHTYEAPFHIRSATGNKGKDRLRAASSLHWQVIDVPAILRLPPFNQTVSSNL